MPPHRYYLPDFIDIQTKSFLTFIKKGILEEFSKRNPITNTKKNIEIFFYPEYFCLTKPEYSIQQAIFFKKSYVSKLYVPVQYTDKKRKLIFIKWILIAQVPLMTKRGHFLLNGAARVIVNQLVRSPGVYFRENFYEIYLNKWVSKPARILQRFYADIICLKGTWIRIEIDKDFCMWVRLKKGPKIPLLWFLLGMGLNEKIIFQSVISPNFLLKSFQQVKEKNNSDYFNSIELDFENTGLKDFNLANKIEISQTIRLKKNLKKKFNPKLTDKTLKISTNSIKYPYVSTTPEAWKQIARLLNLKKTGRSNTKKNKNSTNFLKNFHSFTNTFKKFEESNFSKKKSESANLFTNTFYLTNYQSYIKGYEQNVKTIKENTNYFNLGRKWFFQRFMNPRTYDLGKKGRLALNKKLGLTISPNRTILTAQDLLFITDYLMKVEKGIYPVDDIDHLKNKRIRSAGEFIQMQFGIGLMRLEKTIRLKLNTKQKNYFNRFTSRLSFDKFSSISKRSKKNKKLHLGLQTKKNLKQKFFFQKSSFLHKKNVCSDFSKKNPSILHINVTDQRLDSIIEGSLPAKTSQISSLEDLRSDLSSKQNKSFFLQNTNLQQKLQTTYIQKHKLKMKQFYTANNKQTFIWLTSLIQQKFVNGALKEFFGTHPLSQFMDQMNPLSEITHKRRLTSLGPGGVARDTATLAIRGIHPSHYGRICPIETPEGKNTGLVNSLTVYARVNTEGYIQSVFHFLYKGQIQKSLGKIYLSADQEENFQIATPDLNITKKKFLPKQKIPVRSGKNFFNASPENLSFIGISPLQMISVATALIPFLEHDDANRALMGSNMQRQAVPLIKSERPFVGTGLEAKAISDSGHALTSSKSGFVLYVSGSRIILYTT
jgi:DNA-directed RNA polymerase beta subunit